MSSDSDFPSCVRDLLYFLCRRVVLCVVQIRLIGEKVPWHLPRYIWISSSVPANYYDVKSTLLEQCKKVPNISGDLPHDWYGLILSFLAISRKMFRGDIRWNKHLINNQCSFREYRPIGYSQQDWDLTQLSSAVRAITSSIWGWGMNSEEAKCQGPKSFIWSVSSGAVVEPQGRQLYQHNLRLHVVCFTQTPVNSHQSWLCTSSKHGEKQQTLNNDRPWGTAFWGCEWSSELAGKFLQTQAAQSDTRAGRGIFWQQCKNSQR